MYVVGGSRGTSSGYLTGLYAYDVATSTLLRTVQTWSRGDIRFYVATAGTGDVALVWAGDETDQVNLATGAFAPFRQLPEFLSGYRISSIAW
jgi:hypothetical protein